MRNSLLPILLLVSTVVFALWLIRPHDGEERGAGGPEMFPGIVKIPTRQSRMTASAALDGTTTHSGSAPADAARWRVIVVAGTDDSKLTKAAVFALGEELTKRGCIAILDPKLRDPQEPVPLGSDGCLRVTAVDQPLGKRPGALDATWTIEAIPTRLPADCPAARWLPEQVPSSPTTLTLTHKSTPTEVVPAWPEWFAAVGRAVASETITALQLPTTNLDEETSNSVRRAAWLNPGELDAVGKPLNHFERIPSPPQTDILERTVAFQYPLVRGWIGYLSPVPIKKHSGALTTSRDELVRRLKTKWQPGPAAATGLISYSIDDTMADGTIIHRTITISGDQVIEWQERPQPLAVWETWKKAAALGNADAIELLRSHQHTSGLPEELRKP